MKLILLLPLLVQPAIGDADKPFAIRCAGTGISRDGDGIAREEERIPDQVFVIDPAANTVKTALFPRQEFADVCSANGTGLTSISPGLILTKSDIPPGQKKGVKCEFSVDRVSGKLRYVTHQVFASGDFWESEWRMSCTRTEIPVFDLTKRKF